MKVVCVHDRLDQLTIRTVRRLEEDIHIEGPISPLTIGREYLVQAVELREQFVWLYMQTEDDADWPTPYPVELFRIVESTMPLGWSLGFAQGNDVRLRRITFREWAEDDRFFERLINGDQLAKHLYAKHRVL